MCSSEVYFSKFESGDSLALSGLDHVRATRFQLLRVTDTVVGVSDRVIIIPGVSDSSGLS